MSFAVLFYLASRTWDKTKSLEKCETKNVLLLRRSLTQYVTHTYLGGRVLRISEQLEYAASIRKNKEKKESRDGWLPFCPVHKNCQVNLAF